MKTCFLLFKIQRKTTDYRHNYLQSIERTYNNTARGYQGSIKGVVIPQKRNRYCRDKRAEQKVGQYYA